MPPNTQEEVITRRQENQVWKGTQFEQPAYWETELAKLSQLKVKVNAFYVSAKA
jgi:hypothetical protein